MKLNGLKLMGIIANYLSKKQVHKISLRIKENAKT